MSKASINSGLFNVALLTVLSPINTGSNIATGVTKPVLPVFQITS